MIEMLSNHTKLDAQIAKANDKIALVGMDGNIELEFRHGKNEH